MSPGFFTPPLSGTYTVTFQGMNISSVPYTVNVGPGLYLSEKLKKECDDIWEEL